jgi:competence protein ComEA
MTVPTSLRGAVVRPRRTAVLGLLLVLVLAAGVLAVRVAWARSSATPQPVPAAAHGPPTGLLSRSVPAAFATTPVVPPAAVGPSPAGAGAALTAPAASPATGGAVPAAGAASTGPEVVVHVVGAVARAGVVRLPPGSRVLDAVTAAGGATPGADLPQLNLARLVVDGEQVHVPKRGETLAPAPVAPSGAGSPGAGGSGGAGGAAAPGGAGSTVPVDLNSADAAALDTLPGVGPVLAQRILDWRAEHGRFSSVDELGEVSGIGDKLLAQISSKVRV